MKKKLFAALTCGVMMTGLAACGSSEKTSASNESKPKQEEKRMMQQLRLQTAHRIQRGTRN